MITQIETCSGVENRAINTSVLVSFTYKCFVDRHIELP
jgi:hypothetical protein